MRSFNFLLLSHDGSCHVGGYFSTMADGFQLLSVFTASLLYWVSYTGYTVKQVTAFDSVGNQYAVIGAEMDTEGLWPKS